MNDTTNVSNFGKNMLIKRRENFSKKYGVNRDKRLLPELFENGFVVIDKDAGPTSHQSTDYLKRILEIEKAGHSGTLDPKVTGVLVCGLGNATRLMEYMLKSNKEYILLAYFHKPITDEQLDVAVKKYTGTFMQLPPIVSAIKRQPRERTIYELEVLDVAEDRQHVLMRVRCQHGTYMRKLATDMGEAIGVNCHMKELRRTKAGAFTENDDSVSLDGLRNLMELYKTKSEKVRLNIGIDIDDVLMNTWDSIENHPFVTSNNLECRDVFDWDFSNSKGVDKDELYGIFESEHDKFISKYTPEKNSVKILKDLAVDHNLFVVSGRTLEQREDTLLWLNKHYGDIFDKIVFTKEEGISKKDFCSDLDISIMVEDNLGHAKSIVESGVPVLLFDRYYNQKMDDSDLVTRVFNWKNVLLELELFVQNNYEKELRRHIKPMEYLLRDFRKVIVRDSAVNTVCHGADLAIPGVAMLDDGIEMGEEIAMITGRGQLIGMGMAFLNSKNVMKKKKGLFVKVNKIFMQPGTYPKVWVEEVVDEE